MTDETRSTVLVTTAYTEYNSTYTPEDVFELYHMDIVCSLDIAVDTFVLTITENS